jgi:hypothetical protein
MLRFNKDRIFNASRHRVDGSSIKKIIYQKTCQEENKKIREEQFEKKRESERDNG